jgi:acyl-CoA synthetase (AMP-forming)/AMP-acid ligase II
MLCKGYTRPELTAEAFDAEGFFRTGDLGHLTPEGSLVLTGRSKDIIIRKGENIAAKDIEDVLHQHPKVHAAAVIGVPDADRGERVCAVIEASDPADPPTLAELATFCRDQGLMTQKIPEQLEVRAELPRNPTLKVLKYRLREELSGGPPADSLR